MMVFSDWGEYCEFINLTNSMDSTALRALAESVPYNIPGIEAEIIYDEFIGQFSDEELEYEEVWDMIEENPMIDKITRTENIYYSEEGVWREEEITSIEPQMFRLKERFILNDKGMFAVGDMCYRHLPADRGWHPSDDDPLIEPPFDATEWGDFIGCPTEFAGQLENLNAFADVQTFITTLRQMDVTLEYGFEDNEGTPFISVGDVNDEQTNCLRVNTEVTTYRSWGGDVHLPGHREVSALIYTYKLKSNGEKKRACKASCNYDIRVITDDDQERIVTDFTGRYENKKSQSMISVYYMESVENLASIRELSIDADDDKGCIISIKLTR